MPAIGDAAPLFSGNDFLTDEPFDLADHRGKVVLVAFNGIEWCLPCQAEAPVLVDAWDEVQTWTDPSVQFVMINVNTVPSAGTLGRFGIDFPFLVDDTIPLAYGVLGVPQVFIVDPDGDICWQHTGFSSTGSREDDVAIFVEALEECSGGGGYNPYAWLAEYLRQITLPFPPVLPFPPGPLMQVQARSGQVRAMRSQRPDARDAHDLASGISAASAAETLSVAAAAELRLAGLEQAERALHRMVVRARRRLEPLPEGETMDVARTE